MRTLRQLAARIARQCAETLGHREFVMTNFYRST